MADTPVVAVSRLLNERGLSGFHIKLLVWSLFIVLIDGYDIGAIAFAAPSLVHDWGVDREALGPVFSASLIGILFGSALFGWVGDRYGRKAALIGSLLLFGVFTWIAAYSAQSHADVLAAPDCRHRYRWRHSERHCHQRRIRAAPAARDPGADRGRPACRSAAPSQAS